MCDNKDKGQGKDKDSTRVPKDVTILPVPNDVAFDIADQWSDEDDTLGDDLDHDSRN